MKIRQQKNMHAGAQSNGMANDQLHAIAKFTGDSRPEATRLKSLHEMARQSQRNRQLGNVLGPSRNDAGEIAQLWRMAGSHTSKHQSSSENSSNTGLPHRLRSGIEALSGMDMSDVKVHYNSDKPDRLQAHAYARGNDVYIARGQEKHLPHEAWHIVQQRSGEVKPTLQVDGTYINDSEELERESSVMGEKASRMQAGSDENQKLNISSGSREMYHRDDVAQRIIYTTKTGEKTRSNWSRDIKYGSDFGDLEDEQVPRKEFHKLKESDKEYYIKEQVLHKRPEKNNKRKKTDFELAHEEKSKRVKKRRLSGGKVKKIETGTDQLFENSSEILEIAKTTPGNPVYTLYNHLTGIYNSIDNTSTDSLTENFKLDDVSFNVRIQKQQSITNEQDIFAVVKVILKETRKHSYAGMVENDKYPGTDSLYNNGTVYLQALEALRNPKFIASLIAKPGLIGDNIISMRDTIDPEKYGTYEVIGVAGKERDEFEITIKYNTYKLIKDHKDKEIVKRIKNKKRYKEVCEESCKVM